MSGIKCHRLASGLFCFSTATEEFIEFHEFAATQAWVSWGHFESSVREDDLEWEEVVKPYRAAYDAMAAGEGEKPDFGYGKCRECNAPTGGPKDFPQYKLCAACYEECRDSAEKAAQNTKDRAIKRLTRKCDNCGEERELCPDCGFCPECALEAAFAGDGWCPACIDQVLFWADQTISKQRKDLSAAYDAMAAGEGEKPERGDEPDLTHTCSGNGCLVCKASAYIQSLLQEIDWTAGQYQDLGREHHAAMSAAEATIAELRNAGRGVLKWWYAITAGSRIPGPSKPHPQTELFPALRIAVEKANALAKARKE